MEWVAQGERLRHLREARGLSRHAVAVAVGRVAQSVLNWESGKVRPSIEMVVQLGDLLDAKSELLDVYGYSADQSLSDLVREHERRLNEQEATIARLVALIGLTVESEAVVEARKPRRPKKT